MRIGDALRHPRTNSLMQRRETPMHADADRPSPVNARSTGQSPGRPCGPASATASAQGREAIATGDPPTRLSASAATPGSLLKKGDPPEADTSRLLVSVGSSRI